jgi:hypothetical protein
MPTLNTILRLVRELTEGGITMNHAVSLVSNSFGIPSRIVMEIVENNQ